MPDSKPLQLPCGGCLGCKQERAQHWALRCHLELKHHESAAFITLTYTPENRPACLHVPHLQKFIKRIRERLSRSTPARTLRHFSCGEYGESNGHPHYHGIIFGASEKDRDLIDRAWGLGRTQCVQATPASISYVAGYCDKKLGDQDRRNHWRMPDGTGKPRIAGYVNEETGEWVAKRPDQKKAWKPITAGWYWQEPFLIMSRNPGIGNRARNEHKQSWRDYAIHNGKRLSVPRYLHNGYRETETEQQKEERENRRERYRETQKPKTQEERNREELVHRAKMRLKGEGRKL